MANGVPDLYELLITLADHRYGYYKARYELTERGPYPPAPRIVGDAVEFPHHRVSLATAEVTIPAQVLDPLILPPELGDISGLMNLALLESLGQQWSRGTVAQQMRDVTVQLFQGPARDMLQRMLGEATLPANTIYGSPSGPWAVGRISLDIESPSLRRVPWEMMELGEPVSEELWRRCIIMRRSPTLAGERTGTFDVPVSVAIRTATQTILPDTGWGDGLFDGFTQHARYLGGIEWSEMVGPPPTGEVHHVVYSSAEGLAPLLASLGYRTSGRRMRGGLAVSPDPIQPRLLVLHDVSAHIPPYLTTQIVYEALNRGADAVLLAAFDTPSPSAGGFFPTFYRKLMHNWPLDHCLLAALTVAGQEGALPQGWAFGARQNGELRLLLTGAVVEAAQTAPPAPKAPAPAPRPGRVVRGPRPGPPPPAGAPPPPAPAPEPEAPALQPAPGSRRARAAADLNAQARRAVETRREELAAEALGEAGRMADVSFEAEIEGVAVVVGARERMREANLAIEHALEALDTLDRAEPDTVHQATVRLTNLWLTEGDSGTGRAVSVHEALIAEAPYTLHLKIGARVAEALTAEVFPEEALQEVFERHDKVTLDVMFFSPETDFELSRHRDTLELPRFGDSNTVRVSVKPRQMGQRRLRVCIYYQNVLLQSVLLEASVVQAGEAIPEAAIVARTVDYVASTDLALLEELPQPAVNIFTNQMSDGTHWIGVFSGDDPPDRQLQSGHMHTFGETQLATIATDTRELLAEIEGANRVYRYAGPLPLDAEGKLDLADDRLQRQLETREADLVKLAVRGWRMYHALFLSGEGGLDREQQKNLHESLQRPGIVSIARCRGESTTIPWAALYDLSLDTGRPDRIKLCTVFKDQLAANQWTEGMTGLAEKHDLLDNPDTCRNSAECPLSGPDRKRIVCPFGFWGFLHQVEQPLQQVEPTSLDEVPKELQSAQFNQTSYLVRSPADDVRIAFGAYPDRRILNDLAAHRTEIEALRQNGSLQVAYEEDRDRVLTLLEQGGHHLYYFFCHGERQDNVFMLKLGPSDDPGFISADNLVPIEIDWPDQPQPLVILNGCETMALTPELIHSFLSTLRELGASGAVGSEVKVWTPLAMPFGYGLLKRLLAGQSLGEAFLETRRNLLRQYNPLGLVYAYYAPATLHLHDPTECRWTGHATP